MDEQNEFKPEPNETGSNVARNPDGTFAPGHVAYKNGGRPKGLSFKQLLRHIAEEVAAGEKTWREILIDKAFRRAIQFDADVVLIHLMKQLDDEPIAIDLTDRRIVYRRRNVEDGAKSRFATPASGNGSVNGNGNGQNH